MKITINMDANELEFVFTALIEMIIIFTPRKIWDLMMARYGIDKVRNATYGWAGTQIFHIKLKH